MGQRLMIRCGGFYRAKWLKYRKQKPASAGSGDGLEHIEMYDRLLIIDSGVKRTLIITIGLIGADVERATNRKACGIIGKRQR